MKIKIPFNTLVKSKQYAVIGKDLFTILYIDHDKCCENLYLYLESVTKMSRDSLQELHDALASVEKNLAYGTEDLVGIEVWDYIIFGKTHCKLMETSEEIIQMFIL